MAELFQALTSSMAVAGVWVACAYVVDVSIPVVEGGWK
jgi:hypothetical protein